MTIRKPSKLPPGIRRLPRGNLHWEKMVDGRRFSGTARTLTEARTAMSQVVADASWGGVVDPSTVTVGEYLAQWLAGKQKTRAQRTHEIQSGHLERYVKPQLGIKRLQRLSPSDLHGLFNRLNEAGLGAASQRQVHQFLILALGDAFRLELITRNVAEIVKPTPPRVKDEGVLKAFTPQEAAAFLAACRAGGLRWPEFMLSTGLRRGELCGLRWQDIDWAASTATVVENVVEGKGGTHVSTPKTRGSRRTVHLSPAALALLRAEQADQAQRAEVLGRPVAGHPKGYVRKRPWAASGRVFMKGFGATLDPSNLKREMDQACAAAGVRQLPIHGLRHTCASLSGLRGVPAEIVSKQLGHSNVAFTLNLYRTVFEAERGAWAMDADDLVAVARKVQITHELRTRRKVTVRAKEETPH